MPEPGEDPIVTYEAADRGATCCMGCWAWTMLLAGIGLGLWYITGGTWKLVAGGALIAAGVGLLLFMRSSRRGRWELTFDRDRREVIMRTRVQGTEVERMIPFHEIKSIELEEITRDVTTGDDVPFLRPVFHLNSGERLPVDPRLSVKDPERAREVADEMRGILGLIPDSHPRDEDL